jgi:hypothetical protein
MDPADPDPQHCFYGIRYLLPLQIMNFAWGIGSSPAGGALGNFSTDFDLKNPK